jgi:hypothetical protein
MKIMLTTLSNSLLDKSGRMLNKVLGLGRDDVKTANQIITPGVEGRAVDGSKVIYMETATKGTNVIVGAIEKSQEIEKGEVMIYSRDSNGETQNTIHLKQDGEIEIGDSCIVVKPDGSVEIKGNGDNLMKFIPLNQDMLNLAIDINAELVKIAAGISAGGGAYTPTPIVLDISGAKIDDIKTGL